MILTGKSKLKELCENPEAAKILREHIPGLDPAAPGLVKAYIYDYPLDILAKNPLFDFIGDHYEAIDAALKQANIECNPK